MHGGHSGMDGGGRVLLAGATGALGREVCAALLSRGIWVRAMGRRPEALSTLGADEWITADLLTPSTITGVCAGVDAVISCAGAPMNPGWSNREGFRTVDFLGHVPLIQEAVRRKVRKFVYVSVAGAMALRNTEYAQAHERTVTMLAESGLAYTVVRPTGLFRFYLELQAAARRGLLVLPGNGEARTNPVHEADAALACVEALTSGETQIIAGGPEVFTRKRIAEMAFESQGRAPRVVTLPGLAFLPAALLLKVFQPRLAALVEFGVAVSSVDCIAPAYGVRRLGEYLRSAARL